MMYKLQTEVEASSGYIHLVKPSTYTAFPGTSSIVVGESTTAADRAFLTYTTRGLQSDYPVVGPLYWRNGGDPLNDPVDITTQVYASYFLFRVGLISTTGSPGTPRVGVYLGNTGTALDIGDWGNGSLMQSAIDVATDTTYRVNVPNSLLSSIKTNVWSTLILRNETTVSFGASITIPIDATRSELVFYLPGLYQESGFLKGA